MRITILSVMAVLVAAGVAAQPPGAATSRPAAQKAAANTAQTVTMTGCVGTATGTPDVYILSNPAIVPASAQPGDSPAGIASSSSSTTGTLPAQPAGYRLSGNDMSSWAGRRVEIAGVVRPAAKGSNASGATTTGQTLPEFRVQTVQAVAGDCPQP